MKSINLVYDFRFFNDFLKYPLKKKHLSIPKREKVWGPNYCNDPIKSSIIFLYPQRENKQILNKGNHYDI